MQKQRGIAWSVVAGGVLVAAATNFVILPLRDGLRARAELKLQVHDLEKRIADMEKWQDGMQRWKERMIARTGTTMEMRSAIAAMPSPQPPDTVR